MYKGANMSQIYHKYITSTDRPSGPNVVFIKDKYTVKLLSTSNLLPA